MSDVADGDEDAAVLLRADREAVRAARPSDVVRLLPAFDPWVLGPGTADARLVAPGRRSLVSQGHSLVVRGGVVVGTWRSRAGTVDVGWFSEAGVVPVDALRTEVQRLATIRSQELTLTSATR
ncbi:DNA glycosylase AlkZ-like family protein [Microlunatus capsulatus]|uniref:DNA glycosylase AlkZ-like family protein n=1 Tax=Microlunatus capsulatus TaxID=99117 RepID=UPI0031E42333